MELKKLRSVAIIGRKLNAPIHMTQTSEQKPHDLFDPKGIAVELAQEAMDDIKSTAEEMARSPGIAGSILRLPRERPFAALSIAAALGLTLGLIYARSRFGASNG